MGRTLAAALLCGALTIGMGACGSSNGTNGANGSNTANDSSQSSQTDGNDGSDSGSSESGDSTDDGASDVTPTPADPATVNGTYEFSDFGKDCVKDCKVTVTIKDGMVSAVMSDNFGEYPYWYGTVDADALKSTGKWTSKADADSEQGRKVAKSEFGSDETTKEFVYDGMAKSVDFDLKLTVSVHHVTAKRIG
ncbi:hypothetical protein [Bifidobacterium aesculapii]|uniref:hypothetical protein n=1 Tax=Bifidobacterium aesculapii TaxID=1329411 RepID=UPI0006E3DB6B|nr:hypothetical protein [Bifidobacterium aesculapii]